MRLHVAALAATATATEEEQTRVGQRSVRLGTRLGVLGPAAEDGTAA